jgi:tetratricopeptide (TPR) repeat protein
MSKFATKLLTLAAFSLALATAPVITAVYAAPDDNAPAPSTSTTKSKGKKKSEITPNSEYAAFATGYRAAYATIYDRHDYTTAIGQLKALGHDDSAAVANLIGYSYRKLGDYKLSQVWYERALKADPNHVKTWQYYGLWQV